ncbi:hypothetical protein H072_3898 [Dactylellina haptotyla CBS 200.50]|uniref:Zinc-finger domain-containing protein n=1 Tax=Dactylellina haptotyla (strain CBS 200.50) TaxID=1284197 RepID=S8C3C8_DACHA|nr:hypothetical protein H072_3898 [Dactylellina haptotyla CBS 200.50]
MAPTPKLSGRSTPAQDGSETPTNGTKKITKNEQMRLERLEFMKKLVPEVLIQSVDPNQQGLNSCHQCHGYIKRYDHFLQCTAIIVKDNKPRPCGLRYHTDRICLAEKYAKDEIRAYHPGEPEFQQHKWLDPSVAQWACPKCRSICKCLACKPKTSLDDGGENLKLKKIASSPDLLFTSRRGSGPNGSTQDFLPTPYDSGHEAFSDSNLSNGTKRKRADSRKYTMGEFEVSSADRIVDSTSSTGDALKKRRLELHGISRFNDSIAQRPHKVEAPTFEAMDVEFSDDCLDAKIAIRDFCLRFGSDLGIPRSHFKAIDDPISQWSPSTLKSLISSMLNAIQEIPLEKEPAQRPVNPDQKQLANKGTFTATEKEAVDKAIDAIKKAGGDSNEFWTHVFELLVELGSFEEGKWADFEDSEIRLFVTEKLMQIAVTSPIIRENIDNDLEAGLKTIRRQTWDDIKAERERFESKRTAIQEHKLAAAGNTSRLAKLIAELEDARDTKDYNIDRLELQQWYVVRNLRTPLQFPDGEDRSKRRTMDPRCSTSLGTDLLGNSYHLFAPGPERGSEWGSWIMCRRHKTLEHPTGEAQPAQEKEKKTNGTTATPAAPDAAEENPVDANGDSPMTNGDSTGKKRPALWYAVKGSDAVTDLADWIRFKAKDYWFDHPSDASPKEQPVPDANGDFAVVVVQRPDDETLNPAELATEESIKSLNDKLQEIRRFMAIEESEKAARKKNNLL